MQEKFLRDVVGIVVGKPAEPIAELLNKPKHVNEFNIAKKLDITINQTRNILYKLSDYGLVSYIRKKDKKKGWYTYFWKFENLKVLDFLRNFLLRRKSQFENQISNRESKQFYVCEKCNIELSEANALLYDFTCDECGGIFSLKDDFDLLKKLKKAVAKLDEDIAEIDDEIEKETLKVDKAAAKLRASKKAVKKKTSSKKKTTKKKVSKKESTKKKTSSKKKTTKKKIAKKKVSKKI